MSGYQIRLLGCTNLKKGDVEVGMDTRKAMALLAYLLITGKTHNRDSLATLLWPDSDQPGARGALRRTLSSLRKAVGEEILHTSRDNVLINPDADIFCDAVHFRALLTAVTRHDHIGGKLCRICEDNLHEAVELYAGEFMAGFSLRDSLIFDNWQFNETEQFRRELAGVLQLLVKNHTLSGGYELALDFCRRWLALDPLNETAHRELMLLYAYSGQREAAMRQYRECVRILETEIGVPPLDETTLVYEDIKLNKIVPMEIIIEEDQLPGTELLNEYLQGTIIDSERNTTAPAQSDFLGHFESGRIPRLPLVGREVELEELLTRYYGIKSDGRLAALVGEAGIGKTRLGEEFSSAISNGSIRILSSRCYEGEQELAYSLITSLIRSGIETSVGSRWWESIPLYSLAESARLVPEIAEIVPEVNQILPVEGPGAQTRFFTGVRDVIFKLVTPGEMNGPGVLFLDDLHWIDSASLDLFTFMTRRMKGHPVFVICTWEDIRSENTNRLRSVFSSLQPDNTAVIYPLQRLDNFQTDELIKSAVSLLFVEKEDSANPEEINPQWLNKLKADSEGNPFILTAYLHTIARDRLHQGEIDPRPPESVRGLLMNRLHLVSPTARQILQTAAITGRSFDFQTLIEASGRGEEETISAIEELLSRGLVRETRSLIESGIFYDFSHEIMRFMVCEEVSLARSRLLNRRIAESMEKRLNGRSLPAVGEPESAIKQGFEDLDPGTRQKTIQLAGQLAGQIARHYHLAGEIAKAAQFMYQAGEHEQSLYANKDALQHFENALALGYPDRFSLYMALGDLQVLEGSYNEAIQYFQAAAAQETIASVEGNSLVLAEWKIGQVYGRLGEWQQALHQFITSLSNIENNSGILRIHIRIDHSLALYHLGEFEKAKKIADEVLLEAQALEDTLALAQAHNLVGVLLRFHKGIPAAKEHLEKSLLLAEYLDAPSIRVAAMNNLALAYQNAGQYPISETLVGQALDICIQQGDRHREAALRNHLADLFQIQGKKEAAMDQLLMAVAIFAEIGMGTGEWQPEIWKLVEW